MDSTWRRGTEEQKRKTNFPQGILYVLMFDLLVTITSNTVYYAILSTTARILLELFIPLS